MRRLVAACLFLSAALAAHGQADAIAAKRGDPAFPSLLEQAFAEAGTLADGIALLADNVGYVTDPVKKRSILLILAGALELAGRFPEAADRYEEAAYAVPSARDADSLLASCAARIASGEGDKAEGILKALALTSDEPRIAVKARVLSAWRELVAGRRAEALALADGALALAAKLPALKLEALVVAWAASDGERRAGYAAAIARDYGSTPEAALVSGGAPPPLAHWLLSGVYGKDEGAGKGAAASATASDTATAAKPAGDSKPADAKPGDAKPAPTGQSGQAATATDKPEAGPIAFQIGAFTVEKNAALLVDRLKKAGFAPRVVKKDNPPVWTVLVDAGSDSQATLMKLKDAGFEAFPVF